MNTTPHPVLKSINSPSVEIKFVLLLKKQNDPGNHSNVTLQVVLFHICVIYYSSVVISIILFCITARVKKITFAGIRAVTLDSPDKFCLRMIVSFTLPMSHVFDEFWLKCTHKFREYSWVASVEPLQEI